MSDEVCIHGSGFVVVVTRHGDGDGSCLGFMAVWFIVRVSATAGGRHG